MAPSLIFFFFSLSLFLSPPVFFVLHICLVLAHLSFSQSYLIYFCRSCLPIVLGCFPVPLPPHGNWDASPLSASRYTGRSGRTRTWPRTRCSAWPSSPPCTGPSSPTRAPRCLTWHTWWRACSAWSTGQCLETNGCFVDDQRFVLSRPWFATGTAVMTARR